MTYDIKELHRRMANMIEEIDHVCKAHGLTYHLAYGSMLGVNGAMNAAILG